MRLQLELSQLLIELEVAVKNINHGANVTRAEVASVLTKINELKHPLTGVLLTTKG